MNDKELIQFKMMTLQAAQGNLEQAKLLFEWVAGDSLDKLLADRKAKQEAPLIERLQG